MGSNDPANSAIRGVVAAMRQSSDNLRGEISRREEISTLAV
jgi:hypothetical protein